MATVNTHTAEDGKVTYRARVKVKGHKVLSKTFSTKTAAKRWAQSMEVKLREAPDLAASEAHRHSLSEAIDRYLAEVLPGKAASTRRDQQAELEWWRARLGTLPLAAVTPARLAEIKGELLRTPKQRGSGTLTPATVNRRMATLSHLFTMARREWQWATSNPLDAVRKLREPPGRDRCLTDDEIHRLLDACRISESPDLYTAVLLTLTTGARRMEVMGLTWRDLDLTSGVVTFRQTKNRTTRAVGLVPAVVEILKARPRGIGSALVFPGKPGEAKPGEPPPEPHPINLTTAWETALRRAGIKDFRWHDLRHTAASYLAMEGASLAEIAAVLGHRTLAMVRRYSHLSAEHTARVATKIGERILGGG